MDFAYVARLLNLTLLAPDIVEAILDGREPSGLSLGKLARGLPTAWAEQRKAFAPHTYAPQAPGRPQVDHLFRRECPGVGETGPRRDHDQGAREDAQEAAAD